MVWVMSGMNDDGWIRSRYWMGWDGMGFGLVRTQFDALTYSS